MTCTTQQRVLAAREFTRLNEAGLTRRGAADAVAQRFGLTTRQVLSAVGRERLGLDGGRLHRIDYQFAADVARVLAAHDG